MRVQLRHGDHTFPADLDIEEEVRRGRLFASDEVLHPPWTGQRFRRLGEIPTLADAFDARDARFAAFVRARRFPWATLALVTAVGLAGAVQITATVAGKAAPALGVWVHDTVMRGATGYEPLLLDGAWWTPWTSQFLHAGLLHLLMNLPVLAYCGFRVERALGPAGLAVVGAAAVAGGTALVTTFGTLPVVGASILAYGFWGAQIAIGFRVGDAMPPGWRGFYGWGNLVLFLPLYVSGLGAEGVSHLGHLGGLLGGMLAASLVAAESFAPVARTRVWRRANAALALALGLAPMIAAPALARVPPALAMPGVEVAVPDAGVTLDLPWRMAANPERVAGLPGWIVSHNHDEPVFCALVELRAPVTPDALALAETWERALDAHLEPIEAPPPLGAGWEPHAYVVTDAATGAPRGRLVEQDLRRGCTLVRAGYRVTEETDPDRGREALYRHVLDTLVVGEPPALAEARSKHELYPGRPETTYTLALQLARVGDPAADPLLAALAARTDGWQWDAARARLHSWVEADEAAAHEGGRGEGTGVPDPARAAWVHGWLARAPATDEDLHRDGIRWLVVHGDCAGARVQLATLDALGPDPELRARVAGALGSCAASASDTAVGDAPVGG